MRVLFLLSFLFLLGLNALAQQPFTGTINYKVTTFDNKFSPTSFVVSIGTNHVKATVKIFEKKVESILSIQLNMVTNEVFRINESNNTIELDNKNDLFSLGSKINVPSKKILNHTLSCYKVNSTNKEEKTIVWIDTNFYANRSKIKKLKLPLVIGGYIPLQFNVYKNNEIIAGTTVFESKNVVHSQYISANETKSETGSLDFLHHYLITKACHQHHADIV